MKKVIIIGGGVAGLSAAHELIERGYQVEIFEKQKQIPGGKARSVPVPDTATEGKRSLPGEHGFRFFPGFYRHVTDTMKRIPFQNNSKGVFDNLVPTHTVMMARYDQAPIIALDDLPTSLADIKILFNSMFHSDLGLEPGETEYFAQKVWQLMTSCQARRQNEYERIGWWEFLEADQHSQAYRDTFVLGLTRSLVAAKAESASTKTVGDIFVQLLYSMLDGKSETDRVLNGPTNDVWIDPWLTYLESKGVTYHFDSILDKFDTKGDVINGVWIQEGKANPVLHQADHYISAIPVERMTEKIDAEMLRIDPSLGLIKELADSVNWMNGIQFYLKERTDINKGHVIYNNSEWALTSISQKQFWKDIDLTKFGDGQVKDILSVDISDWFSPDAEGRIASQSTKEVVIKSVWEQLKKSLNVDGKTVLSDENLHHVHLDSDIIFKIANDGKVTTQNEEPLLVNKVNTWALRPFAHTRIQNLYLAADYVKTNTDLATMEGANEAARRAVNCILDIDESSQKPCKIWNLHESWILALYRKQDVKRYQKGLPYQEKLPWFVRLSIKIAKWVKKIF